MVRGMSRILRYAEPDDIGHAQVNKSKNKNESVKQEAVSMRVGGRMYLQYHYYPALKQERSLVEVTKKLEDATRQVETDFQEMEGVFKRLVDQKLIMVCTSLLRSV